MKNILGWICSKCAQIHSLCFALPLLLIATYSFAQPDTWKQKQSLQGGARYDASGFSIGDKGYVGTGIGENDLLKDFWEFDPVANSWTQKANYGGTPTFGATAFSIGKKGYLGTGNDANGSKNDFWEYDQPTNTWTRKANFGGGPVLGAHSFTIANKGYLGGNDVFWEYDPAADLWTKKAEFYPGYDPHTMGSFRIGDKGYLCSTYPGGFWEYDPKTDAWTEKASFDEHSEERHGGTAFSIGNRGYATGGSSGSDYFTVLKEYDPQKNTWVRKADLPAARYNGTSFSIGDKGYYGFGYYDQLRNDMWEYTPGFSNTINTVVIDPDQVCSRAPVAARSYYTATGHFETDNKFTAQLSNASGSFENAVNIGTISSNADHGKINVTIPAGTPSGTGYHIRVVSTHPAVIGSDNEVGLSINPPPTVKTKNITVSLNDSGTVSIKPSQVNNGSVGQCGGNLTYELDKTTFNCSNLGANIVTLTVKDCQGSTAKGTAVVTVRDCTPPVIDSACASPGVLWPPDHTIRDVIVTYTTTDNCKVASTSLSVTSNVPPQGSRPDWIIINNHYLLLRAAGSSTKERTYFIKITARDGSGNTSTKTVKVIVPKKQQGAAENQNGQPGNGDVAGVDQDGGSNSTANATRGLHVRANPNPSTNYFTIISTSNSLAPITINITDLAGRIIEKRSNIAPNSMLRFGDLYGRGIYFVQAIQGNERVTLKLIKN